MDVELHSFTCNSVFMSFRVYRDCDRRRRYCRQLVLQLKENVKKKGERPFRYIAAWQQHPNFQELLGTVWDKDMDLEHNLSEFKKKVTIWNKETFGHIGKKKKNLLVRIRGIWRALETRHSEFLNNLVVELLTELDIVLEQEESLWRQKACSQWVTQGDRNTKYFHASTLSRRQTNNIAALKQKDNSWCTNETELALLARDFFQKLFSSSTNGHHSWNIRGCFPKLEAGELEKLIEPVTNEEIKKAFFGMGPLKAPGIDGEHAAFYQKKWSVVGESVCACIQKNFAQGSIPADWNQTLSVLIPKITTRKLITQFQPISLCTVIYKAIIKIIANRLKHLMPMWISENQTSFVPWRSITDNIIITQDVIHSLRKKKGIKGWMAIKIDLEKAYDRLEWSFIDDMLSDLGIPDSLCQLTMNSVTPVSTQILWNGSLIETFKPTRDDMLLFAEASVDQMHVIRATLDEFCEVSGHKVNHGKTNIFFSKNVPTDLRNRFSLSFGFKEVKDLGRTHYTGQSRTRSNPSVHNANGNSAQKKTCEELERITRRFIWGITSERGGVHLVKWKDVCHPISHGGLGLRNLKNLKAQNEAFIMKLAFNLIAKPEALWVRFLRAKYKCKEQVPTSLRSTNCSRVWKGLSIVWNDVQQNIQWFVGNDTKTDFWHDNWINATGPLFRHIPPATAVSIERRTVARTDAVGWRDRTDTQFTIQSAYKTRLGQVEETNEKILIKPDKLQEFLSLELKYWIELNLTRSSYFAKESSEWELLFGAVCCNLWMERNSVTFNNPMEDTRSMLERSKHLQMMTCKAREGSISQSIQDSNGVQESIQWISPDVECCKLNKDGVRSPNDGIASCGGVMRDSNGLSCAWDFGLRKIMLEVDSMDAFRLLQGDKMNRGSSYLLQHIYKLLRRNWTDKVQHKDERETD
ncbi:uncharacterized protein LOC120166816 [Hibiscus syriacus]|uniref:uncharacterized protein LOC120166816 n=1 Tax=Hibiscus syriacus TaxID=106335 RepID=UPI0019220CE5|nr:uncharacterized protein LOC120166816 [Hibiscus syriacus]